LNITIFAHRQAEWVNFGMNQTDQPKYNLSKAMLADEKTPHLRGLWCPLIARPDRQPLHL
jgi:hypothetical protein